MKWELIWIPISAVIIYAAVRGCAWLLARYCGAELDASDAARRDSEAICLYPDAESLEYLTRCAVAATDGTGAPIIICIREGDRARDEMIAMTACLARQHPNIRYRLI